MRLSKTYLAGATGSNVVALIQIEMSLSSHSLVSFPCRNGCECHFQCWVYSFLPLVYIICAAKCLNMIAFTLKWKSNQTLRKIWSKQHDFIAECRWLCGSLKIGSTGKQYLWEALYPAKAIVRELQRKNHLWFLPQSLRGLFISYPKSLQTWKERMRCCATW